ncbi:CubicO group peptidase (beta-lactamase class C family) [Pseudoxanthomonas japonensis]|nr:serine hydrolase domain-containing protein [Pseudoxanthomonas japonensis]MDR7069271.1 CubicO group peptidase (beta-lactamase class C family) [Pseudoxanthomonas japonensis]
MTARTSRAIAIIVFMLLLHTAAPARAATLGEANRQASAFVQATMRAQRIPGLQIAVIQDGQVVLSESHGFANVENHVPVTRDTRFPINSATKAFTGVAIMQLVEAGRVDLAAPLSRYVAGVPQDWQDIRVRQLLAHTSGLPDLVDEHGLVGGGSEHDAWQAIRQRPVDAPAGERFVYNQTNYALLAQIIAGQSGLPYEAHVARHQFSVAGMPSSTFGDSYDLIPGAATLYSYFPRKTDAQDTPERLSHWFHDMPYGLWAGGGIQTTADDVAHWLIALSAGRLISKANVREMWTPERLNRGTDGRWGAGWPVLATTPHRQIAGMGGARAALIVYPDDGLAVVVLTNLVGANPQDFIPAIAAYYLPSRTP